MIRWLKRRRATAEAARQELEVEEFTNSLDFSDTLSSAETEVPFARKPMEGLELSSHRVYVHTGAEID